MKPQLALRLTLLVPYLLWGIAVISALTLVPLINASIGSGAGINLLLTPILIYAYGVVIWGIPYTLLATGLWVWSRNKNTQNIVRTFALAPIMLAMLTTIEMLAVVVDWSNIGTGLSQVSTDFGASVAGVIGLALAYGYFCIGMTWVTYRVYKQLVSRHEHRS